MKETKIKEFAQLVMRVGPMFKRAAFMPPPAEHFKLTPLQFFCLPVLAHNPGMTMGELASCIGISNQHLTKVVDALVENNLVERYTDEGNRRQVKVRLSEQGKHKLGWFDETFHSHIQQMLSELTETDIDECIYHLSQLEKLFSKLPLLKSQDRAMMYFVKKNNNTK